MVQIIIEDILSTSTNRILYEALWNLSIAKSYKPKNSKTKKSHADESISEICNKLIEEIKRDEPDRTMFYFSTQLVFGTLLMYKFQVEKFYNQVKHASQSCVSTFFEINWLTQLTECEYPPVIQVVPRKRKSIKKTNKKKQIRDTKHQLKNVASEIDFLEQIFKIPEATQEKKSENQIGPEKEFTDLDPTMAMSVNQITLMDNTAFSETFTQIGDEMDFGDVTLDFDFSFRPSAQKKQQESLLEKSYNFKDAENDQEVPDILQSPDILRHAPSPIPIEFPEPSFATQVMDFVSKQKSVRKRRSSNDRDISHRIGASFKKTRMEDNENDNEVVSEPNVSSIDYDDTSSFYEKASIEKTSYAKASESLNDTYTVEEHNNNDMNFIDLAFMQRTPLQKPAKSTSRKRKLKNSKLIFDKQTSFSSKALKTNVENYEKKFCIKPPMETFEYQMKRQKLSYDVIMASPASHLKLGASKLMTIYSRNLKKVPMKLQKRSRENSKEKFESPPKKRRTERKTETLIVPEVEDLAPPIPAVPYHSIQFDDIGALPINEQQKAFENVPQNVSTNIVEYQEEENWSKQTIMNKLKTFWDRNDDHITMGKLSAKNRFVAAGIFFELLVLSKVGAVELAQNSNLEITHIMPGFCANLYI